MRTRTRRTSKEQPKVEVPPTAPRPGRSYEDMGDERDEGHPIDEAVERRLEHAVLRRRIRTATDRLMEALGEEFDLWLRLEELLGELHLDREAAYFDIGYEHGRAAGHTEALAEERPRAAPAYRELTQRIREAAVGAGIPPAQAMAALLEAAWALILGEPSPSSRTGVRGGGRR